MTMQNIRDIYGIPVKRGMRVTWHLFSSTSTSGHITSVKDGRIRTSFSKNGFHPGDLDYYFDGAWHRGRDYVDIPTERVKGRIRDTYTRPEFPIQPSDYPEEFDD